MCIICAKKRGVIMPDRETLKTMFTNNSDGAGYMYAVNGVVHIHKGFMRFTDLITSLEYTAKKHDLNELPIIFHFRISTSGATNKSCCHPFPVTDSAHKLKATRQKTSLGVAHNGIIPLVTPTKELNDTMVYTSKILYPLYKAYPKMLFNEDIKQVILETCNSKLAFLDGRGNITLIGEFNEDSGIYYSNYSYINYKGYYDYNNYYDNYRHMLFNHFMPAGFYYCYNFKDTSGAGDMEILSNGKNLKYNLDNDNFTYYQDNGNAIIFDCAEMYPDDNLYM